MKLLWQDLGNVFDYNYDIPLFSIAFITISFKNTKKKKNNNNENVLNHCAQFILK